MQPALTRVRFVLQLRARRTFGHDRWAVVAIVIGDDVLEPQKGKSIGQNLWKLKYDLQIQSCAAYAIADANMIYAEHLQSIILFIAQHNLEWNPRIMGQLIQSLNVVEQNENSILEMVIGRGIGLDRSDTKGTRVESYLISEHTQAKMDQSDIPYTLRIDRQIAQENRLFTKNFNLIQALLTKEDLSVIKQCALALDKPLVAYYDDLIFISQNQQELIQKTNYIIIKILENFWWKINRDKPTLIPTKQIEYLIWFLETEKDQLFIIEIMTKK
ncbi:MAG: hypothetical protein EZS28_017465 [Streblomastix strix]|uniref:Uncharacterized protein n=1 Tax=Streblomastix strix TaxID=222440 RepID=A0A5J4VWJ3_9EUKA|nr:MAG: hypothetical protein EZS28_017465 [Streblomastix strix]